MRFGSLFTGIGGLDLGLERAGFECMYQVEIDDFCRKVLTKRWPAVPKFGDICEIKELPKTDLIAGGFPCQDLSFAGKGAGITGERSGLWKEFARIVATCKPKYVLIENVPALRHRGMEVVLQDLARLGYDAVWDCVPASDFGAPFERKRLYIIAFPAGKLGAQRFRNEQKHDWKRSLFSSGDKRSPKADRAGWLQTEPNLGGVADGIPDRVDRVTALGNAVVPCAGEFFGRVITNLEKQI